MKKFVTLYLAFFPFIFSLTAQNNIWPVQVTGVLVPPHSLDLKAYSTDRVNDLSFQVFLKDPVEQSLQVRPVLTIEQNGTILYQTDMNFAGEIVTLTQFEPFMLDGTILNRYLSSEALTGRAGQGRGASLIPEGFNQICLQMYGVERSVPVSNKFCVSGNFRLNQPPQIIKPSFNEKIKMPPVQNMIFSWMPMHLGSGNNPGAVDYLFELVALPQGVMNANDVFDSALKVYTTTTNATSLIYSQAEPLLLPGVYYAWRVRASSMLHPTSNLFQNDGKSEISVFVLYDGEAPTNDLNPFDNPAPRGCSVYETGYGPVSKADNEPMILAPNQDVKLGFFTMKVTEASGNGQVGYSGKGLIAFPMLRSTLEVEFTNVKVNKEGRVYESESIEANSGPFTLSKEQLSPDNIARFVNNQYASEMYRNITDNKKVALLPDDVSKRNELPLALVNEQNPSVMVCVTGIYFTPSNAFLNVVGFNDQGDGGNFDISAATAIQATPYGLKSGSYLVPISQSTNAGNARQIIPTIEMVVSSDGSSKLFCDCNGITESKLKENLQISPDILVRADNGGPVVLELSDKKAEAKTYFGEVKGLSEFEMKGMKDFRFSAESVWVDLDPAQKVPLNDIPADSELSNVSGRGIVLNEGSCILPPAYNIINQEGGLKLNSGTIIINEEKIESAYFYKHNLLSLEKGKFGPWSYSIDTFSLKIAGETQEVSFAGEMKTPFFSDLFSYKANMFDAKTGQTKIEAKVTKPELQMPMWKGIFEVKDASEVAANLFRQEDKYILSPKCSFNGNLSMNLTDAEFRNAILNKNKGEVIDELLKSLNLNSLSLNLNGLSVEGLRNDPYNEEKKRYQINNLDLKNTKLSFGEQPDKLKDATFIVENNDDNPRLGLKLTIIKGKSKIEMIVWSKSDKNDFEFEGIEIRNIELKCDCASIHVLPTPEEWNEIIHDFYEKQYGQLYNIQISNGSLSNYISEESGGVLKMAMIEKIKSEAISWFPLVDENKIFIPFLNKNLIIENKEGKFSGSYRDENFRGNDIKWDAKLFGQLENETGEDLKLPIVIDRELWHALGFKSAYNLPDNFKLIISTFTSSASDKLSNAIVEMDLVAELYIDGKQEYLHFGTTENIAIGPEKIDLKDKIFYLLNHVDLNQNITFLSTKNRISSTGNKVVTNNESYARVNCDNGVELFNVLGNYKVNTGTIIISNSNPSSVKSPAVFGFRLIENKIANNDYLLSSFIANIKTDYFADNAWKPWNFSANNAQHIIFKAGEKFVAFLDYDESNSPEGSEKEDYFTGLTFKNLDFDIPFLETAKLPDGTITKYSDTTGVSYFDHLEQNFNVNYADTNKVVKANKATIGTWEYVLDSIAFNIQNNELDENELLLKGKIRVPIFKEAPKEGTEKWLEDYNDSWVDYALNVGYNSKLQVSGYLQQIEDKMFESVHIDGIGYKLENGSYMEMGYNGNNLLAKAIFTGRIFYTIKPLNASISTLKFQDLKLNHSVSDVCKGEGFAGINSIDFGTWSPALFSPSEMMAIKSAGEKAANSKSVKENKFYKKFGDTKKGFNQIANFEINIHEPKFTCNKDNDRILTIGLELNISRDASNLTEAQQAAYDKNHPEETLHKDVSSKEKKLDEDNASYTTTQKAIKDLVKEKRELYDKKRLLEVSYKLSNVTLAKADANSRQRKTDLENQMKELTKKLNENAQNTKAALTKVKTQWKDIKAQKSQLKTTKDQLENVKNLRIAKETESKNSFAARAKNAKDDFKAELKNAKETKTFAITAGGSIDVVFNNKGFKRVDLNCLKLGGKFGPVGFTGGINIFREDTESATGQKIASTTKWGNGFLGLIKVAVLNNEFAAKFQTGVKYEAINNNSDIEDYRYWFADLSFNSEIGIPLGQSGFALTGVGGGFYYNMGKDLPAKFVFDTPENNSGDTKDNSKCELKGLEPGVSLSGLLYKTSRYSMGGYLSAEISHKSKISAEVIVSLQVKNDPKDGLKFENFGLDLNGYCFYDDYLSRKESSPLIFKSNLTLANEKEFNLSGNIKFRFVKEASPIKINAPEQVSKNFNDEGNWNTIVFSFSKKNQYFRAGSWRLPNREASKGPASGMYFLNAMLNSPLINAKAGLFCQIGSAGTVDVLPDVTYLMGSDGFTNDVEKNNPLNKLKSGSSLEMMAGLRLEAQMKDKFLLLSYDANGLLGANIRLNKVSATSNKCVDFGKIGFSNGYYASGNVYADLKMKADLFVDFTIGICPFCTEISESYTILDAAVKTVMNFGFPNPSFLQGKVDAKYNLLGGLVKGNKTVDLDVGKKPCGAVEPDPTVGIAIHDKIFPSDGAKDIQFLKKIEITNNFGDAEKIPINPNALSGGASTASDYTIYANAVNPVSWLKEKGSNKPVKVNPVWSEDKKNLTLQILEELKANTTYMVYQDYTWKKGANEKIGEEKMVTEFTTGEFDDEVNHDLVISCMPGRGQRYWRSGYGYPGIVFNNNESELRKIFPNDREYYYYVEVVEYTSDGIQKYHRVPVSQVPFGSDKESFYPYELDQPLYPGWPNNYYVTFREFSKLEIGKGSLCLLKLVRAIDKNVRIDEYDPHHVESDSIRYIYEYHFGTSTYGTMTEKLRDVKHNWNPETKSIMQSAREIHVKEEIISEYVDKGIASGDPIPEDKIWGFKAKTEGFDKYDIALLNNNLLFTWDSTFNVYKWLCDRYNTNFKQYAGPVSDYDLKYNIGFGPLPFFPFPSHMKKTYWRLADEYSAAGPYVKILASNDTKSDLLELSNDEIENKKLKIRKAGSDYNDQYSISGSNNYDFIVEDGMASTMVLMSRIIVDAMDEFNKNEFFGTIEPIKKGQFEDKKYPEYPKTFYPANLTFSFYESKKNGYCYYYEIPFENEKVILNPVFLIDYKKIDIKKLSK